MVCAEAVTRGSTAQLKLNRILLILKDNSLKKGEIVTHIEIKLLLLNFIQLIMRTLS